MSKDPWNISSSKKKKINERVEKKLNKKTLNKKTSTGTPAITNWYIQSAVYLVAASYWQAENAMRQGIELPLEEHFIIGLISFGIPSWLLISGTMYLIERKKPEEERSNILLWVGLGFLGIIVFI